MSDGVALPLNPPAIIRPAVDLDALAARINANCEAGEKAMRDGLERYKQAGDDLLAARERCGRGWLKWLAANVRCSRVQAAAYMRVASRWEECKAALHLKDAIGLLNTKAKGDRPTRRREPAQQPEASPALLIVPERAPDSGGSWGVQNLRPRRP